MLDSQKLVSDISAAWNALMQAKRGFYSAIIATALIVGAVVYVLQEYRIWFLEKQIDQLQTTSAGDSKPSGVYRLTSEQWARFVEAAKVPSGKTYRVFTIYNDSCEECAIFARHLFNRLTLIPGWTVEGGAGMLDPLLHGLIVGVYSKTPVTEEAKAIASALQATGLNVVISEDPGLRENAMPHLAIGIPK